MTPKEIVFTALDRKVPPRLPVAPFGGGVWTIFRSGTTFKELSTDVDTMTATILKIHKEFQQDIVFSGSGFNNLYVGALGGTIKFREVGAPDLVEPMIKDRSDIDKLDLDKVDHDPVVNTIREATRNIKKAIGDETLVTMTCWGPFTMGAQLYEVERYMRAIAKDKESVHAVNEFAVEFIKRIYEPLIDDGTMEMVTISDPTVSGDLCSFRQFKEFSLPYTKRLVEWLKEKGVRSLLHVCGDTRKSLEFFAETGADCVSLDAKVDIKEAKEKIGDRICISGNINPVHVLDQGDEARVREFTEETLKKVGEVGFGGYISMPGCDNPPSVPDENMKLFFKISKEWDIGTSG